MEWTRGHTIGQGSTATVSVATIRGSSEIFAVKSVKLSKTELLQREQKILSALDHPRIVGYKGCDITIEQNHLLFNLKMEYLPGGTLSDAITKSGGRLDESTIACYTRQIVEGLDYLHSIGVVHCDLKGHNILLGQSGAKIADFGCAKWQIQESGTAGEAVTMVGTPLFMAPEVARGEEQGYPADIWALGCTILQMARGCSPWPNATNAAALLYRIGFSGDLPEIPEFLSDQARDFLCKCLRRDPKQRWTAKELLKHQFIDEFSGILKPENQDSCTTSPTSILDQGIWKSVEESKTLMGCMIPEHSSNLPGRRLRLWFFNSGVPNWTRDENWITIREEKLEDRSKQVESSRAYEN